MADISPPAGLRAIVGGPIDIDEFYALVSAVSVAAIGRVEWSADILGAFVALPAIDPARDRVFVRDDGVLVGATMVEHASPYVSASIHGFVDPTHQGRGVGTSMLEWAIRRARERLELAPLGARVTVDADAYEGYRPSIALLEEFGFSAQRFFLEMAVTLADRPDDPKIPVGITFRTFDGTTDLPLLSRVVEDAFQDHFGHVPGTEAEALARFQVFTATDAWSDDLAWIAFDGTEAVGAIVAIDRHGDDTATGYIATLGVRRGWRGRGIAHAMLLTAFGDLFDMGRSRVVLHVDAQSPTGATRLYERVGMSPVSRSISYVYELRSGDDHVVR